MDAQLTNREINDYREILQDDDFAQKALATLEKTDGRFYASFDELLSEASGLTKSYELARLRQGMLKQLREAVGGNDSFGTKFQEYSQNLESKPVLRDLIASLVRLVADQEFPLDPAIAMLVVLYMLKIGLNIFCEYTETSTKPPTDAPESRRIPHD